MGKGRERRGQRGGEQKGVRTSGGAEGTSKKAEEEHARLRISSEPPESGGVRGSLSSDERSEKARVSIAILRDYASLPTAFIKRA